MNIISVYLEVSNICNLKCAYCYNTNNEVERHELSYDNILKVLNFCKKKKIELIFSGGEPFLHSDFPQILNIISNNDEVQFGIVSNGTLIENIDLLPHNVTLHLSLDSFSKEINAFSRSDVGFSSIISAIRELQKHGRSFYVKKVINKYNVNDNENFINQVLAYGGIPQFSFVEKQAMACNNWLDLNITDEEKVKVLKELDVLSDIHNVRIGIPGCLYECPYLGGKGSYSISIDCFGKIYPCQIMRSGETCLGCIDELDRVSDRINDFVKKMSVKPRVFKECEKCYLKNICKRGCPAKGEINNGSIFANDAECNVRRSYFMYKLQKEGNVLYDATR